MELCQHRLRREQRADHERERHDPGDAHSVRYHAVSCIADVTVTTGVVCHSRSSVNQRDAVVRPSTLVCTVDRRLASSPFARVELSRSHVKLEDGMKRERTVQVVLVLVGFLYSTWIYPLFDSLWQSSWLPKHQDAFPMFMSVNAVLGVFLLLAVKHPARHRSLIAFGAWSTLAHALTMAVMSAEAWSHGM